MQTASSARQDLMAGIVQALGSKEGCAQAFGSSVRSDARREVFSLLTYNVW